MRSVEQGLRKAMREREAKAGRGSAGDGGAGEGAPDLEKLSPYLVTVREPKSLVAEQFKRMRTQVLRKLRKRMAKTLMVTSSVPGEGKTTAALNLAISISQGISESVLMIDTDLRKPGLHTHLGIPIHRGLVDYLQGKAEIEDLIVKTEIPKLSLLPSGRPPENPSELLGSDRMAHLIDHVRARYENRFILLDTSPVNVFADTAVLLPQVEGILFVIRDGATPREYVLRALSQLKGGQILGVCLNMISAPETLLDSYYYYYSYNTYEASYRRQGEGDDGNPVEGRGED